MYENQRETLYNQQFNMEQTRFTVESIQVRGPILSRCSIAGRQHSSYLPIAGRQLNAVIGVLYTRLLK
jgi:hypothetical protein